MRLRVRRLADDALPFLEGEDPVDGRKAELLDGATGPVDLDGVDLRRIAEAEVHPRVVRGEITAAAEDIAALARAIRDEVDGRADGIAGALWTADQLQLDPVVIVLADVAQQDGV